MTEPETPTSVPGAWPVRTGSAGPLNAQTPSPSEGEDSSPALSPEHIIVWDGIQSAVWGALKAGMEENEIVLAAMTALADAAEP